MVRKRVCDAACDVIPLRMVSLDSRQGFYGGPASRKPGVGVELCHPRVKMARNPPTRRSGAPLFAGGIRRRDHYECSVIVELGVAEAPDFRQQESVQLLR
jgi:hypothetical protein